MLKFSENTQDNLDEILDSYLLNNERINSEVQMSYLDFDLDDKIDDYILNGYQ
jgi:hypothetical protein